MLVSYHITTQHHSPDDLDLKLHYPENSYPTLLKKLEYTQIYCGHYLESWEWYQVDCLKLCVSCLLEKELITPPLDGLILPGITRASILQLSREWNEFLVSERSIPMAEIVRLCNENRVSQLFSSLQFVWSDPVI